MCFCNKRSKDHLLCGNLIKEDPKIQIMENENRKSTLIEKEEDGRQVAQVVFTSHQQANYLYHTILVK